MSMSYPSLHEGFVPAYMMSATPFVTSSLISTGEIHVIEFPQVTRFFNVQNSGVSGDEIAVAFTLRGLSSTVGNYFTVGQGVAFRDELRCTKLFVSCTSGTSVRYQVVAGLTNIPSSQFTPITGSNGYAGVG